MAATRSSEELWVCHLGVVEYRLATALQEQLRARRQADELPDVLLTLEHPPVYTRGRRSAPAELPMSADFYRWQGIEIVPSNRGGRVTYHGPGQLVGYPIMRIEDVLAYVRTMEAALIGALGEERVAARVRKGLTGVWVGERKLASIGVHVSRGVSTHGFAVNVENDLEPFSWVMPCGLADVTMTSVAMERGGNAGLPCFRRHAAHHFCQAHGRRQRLVSPQRLGLPAGLPLAHPSTRGPERPRRARPLGPRAVVPSLA